MYINWKFKKKKPNPEFERISGLKLEIAESIYVYLRNVRRVELAVLICLFFWWRLIKNVAIYTVHCLHWGKGGPHVCLLRFAWN